MTAFIDAYDAAFFDLDGVAYLGPVAIEGAPEGVRALQERGVRTLFVTNNAARSAEAVAAHLIELGFPAHVDDLVTSAQAARSLLRDELPAGSRVLVAGTDNLVEHVRQAGMVPVAKAADEPVAVIQGYHPTLNWDVLSEASIAVGRGAAWYATNTDSTRPTERGLVPGAGMMVAAVSATTTRQPTVVGKPHRPLMAEAVRRSGAANPVFVGDRIDTDIMGAHAVGIASFLVFTGAHGRRELCAAPANGRPTAIGYNVGSLLEPVRAATMTGSTARCRGVEARAVEGRVELSGSITTRDQQLDALWAIAQLAWAGLVSTEDAALDRLDLLP